VASLCSDLTPSGFFLVPQNFRSAKIVLTAEQLEPNSHGPFATTLHSRGDGRIIKKKPFNTMTTRYSWPTRRYGCRAETNRKLLLHRDASRILYSRPIRTRMYLLLRILRHANDTMMGDNPYGRSTGTLIVLGTDVITEKLKRKNFPAARDKNMIYYSYTSTFKENRR